MAITHRARHVSRQLLAETVASWKQLSDAYGLHKMRLFVVALTTLAAVLGYHLGAMGYDGLVSAFHDLAEPVVQIIHSQAIPSRLGNLTISLHPNYHLAFSESLGFFDDILESEWEVMRSITLNRINNAHSSDPMHLSDRPNMWYQENWDPDFSCRHDTKVGGIGDGGKWVCDPHRIVAQSQRRRQKFPREPGCIVYSIGSRGDFSFEEGLQREFGGKPGSVCEIHTFDFGDYQSKVPADSGIVFHQWGLKPSYRERQGTTVGEFGQKTSGKFKTLKQTMKQLGHTGRAIDIFKIDCEGCEWGTFKDWLEVDIRQILVEVHKVPQIGNAFFQTLQQAGYVTFHKEPNTMYGGGMCVEYAFLKLSRNFVEKKLRQQELERKKQLKAAQGQRRLGPS